MGVKEWVIDTCVLKQANEYDYESMSFIVFFAEREDNILCIDIDGHLLEQYKNHFSVYDGDSLVGSIWIKLDRSGRISYKTLRGLPRRIRDDLTNRLKFDSDDMILVEIAWESKESLGHGRIVTVDTQQGDFDTNVQRYLKENGIIIYTPKTAKNEL